MQRLIADLKRNELLAAEAVSSSVTPELQSCKEISNLSLIQIGFGVSFFLFRIKFQGLSFKSKGIVNFTFGEIYILHLFEHKKIATAPNHYQTTASEV